MARFLLPEDHTFHFSSLPSHHLHSSRDSRHGTPQGSAPATPEKRGWKSSYDDMFGRFENERGNSNSNLHVESSNRGLYSYQSLVQEQIRAIELRGVKQECRKSEGQKKRPPRPGIGMRALSLDGPTSRAGTGVFLPRAGPGPTSQSTKNHNNKGKGCSSVLIPARVVQALQLHFHQMAATSGLKRTSVPPLHDVLVSNRDGMYSLQNRQSRNAPASIHNDANLPQEWTY